MDLSRSFISTAYLSIILAINIGCGPGHDPITPDLKGLEQPNVDQSQLINSAVFQTPYPVCDRDRKSRLICSFLVKYQPKVINGSASCPHMMSFALGALHLGVYEQEAKNALTSYMSRENFTGNHLDKHISCYWGLPTMARIMNDPLVYSKLSPSLKNTLLNKMIDFVYERSHIADLNQEGVWTIWGTGNHDIHQKGSTYLFLEALVKHGQSSSRLADGRTALDHRLTWINHLTLRTRLRGREGIHIEVASPTYEKYTLPVYYSIYNFSSNSELRKKMGYFLNLHWIDFAHDFIPSTGIRAGAATRVYKDRPLYRLNETSHTLAYAYDWHNFASGLAIQYQHMSALTSRYYPPSNTRSFAKSLTKKPYMYVSRRMGRGITISSKPSRKLVTFGPENSSDILRTSYWTKDYVLGAMTFNPNTDYLGISTQNRVARVNFASHRDAQIAFLGIGDSGGTAFKGTLGRTIMGKNRGFNEVTGLVNYNCMGVGMDSGHRYSRGFRIFISKAGDLWKNHESIGGWLFTRSGGGYAALRVAEGGYTIYETSVGTVLDLNEKYSPVILQMAQSSKYSYGQFKSVVLSRKYKYASGRLSYKCISNNKMIFYKQAGTNGSAKLPEVYTGLTTGAPADLNPAKTYDSPYITGWHGTPPSQYKDLKNDVLFSYEGNTIFMGF